MAAPIGKSKIQIPQTQVPDTRNPRVLEAARMYEQQFLREMVRAMRSTVPESELVQQSMGEKIYKGQLDDEYVEQWTSKGGIGLADMIYDHIMERFMNQRTIEKPKGPLPLDNDKPIRFKVETKEKGVEVQVQPGARSGSPTTGVQNILAPWSGKVASVFSPSERMQVCVLDHDNGLQSTFVFDGRASVRPGDQVEAGARLGFTDIEQNKIHWKLLAAV